MDFIRRNINVLFVFILPVYFYIVQNSIQNKHTHVYANGIVVTHSHPVDAEEEPINNHEHTKTEICLFSCLHLDFYNLPEFTDLPVVRHTLHSEYILFNERIESRSFVKHAIPRGPPA